jgi:predicted O-linked N-acetylglucosamine transferase (SPINDLY family)
MMMYPNSFTSASAIQAAFDLARQGELQSAESLCIDILRQDIDHPEVLLLRAAIETRTGRTAEAAVTARRSIERDANRPAAHALLGDALLALDRPLEALESYDAALRLSPALLSAQFGRGNALLDLHRPREALSSYEGVLMLQPGDAQALFNRGNALFQLNELQAALESYDRAIAAEPSYASALSNRGSVLMLLERPEAALASFEAALAISPDLTEALYHRAGAVRLVRSAREALESYDRVLRAAPHFVEAFIGRGEILKELGRPADALEDFDRALRVRADSVPALRGRGDVLLELDRPAEALAAHDAALRLGTQLADTHNSRGNSLRALQRFPEAIDSYDECLRLDPRNAVAHYNRGAALLQWGRLPEEALAGHARALQLRPDLPYAPGALYYAQMSRADWCVMAPAASREHILKSVLAGKPVVAPFAFLSMSDSAAAQLACARSFVARHYAAVHPIEPAAPRKHGRIRVAYVSADLREHAVSYLMTGIFEAHDRERFEIIGISLKPAEASAAGERVQRAFDRFIDGSKLRDGQVAELMRGLEIDIAVDLGGFTDGFRSQIFARRAAPLQVNYLGYPATMGADFIDYLIADRFVIPEDMHVHYSERIVYLPDSFQANDGRRVISDRTFTRQEQGLPQGAFVFCCLNNTPKINPQVFAVWMRVLARVPGSVLWLLGEGEAERDNLRREARSRGLDEQRILFAARAAYPEHLSRIRLADLFLDTLPFNGGTTASDALWAGLPLLTCAGEAFAARMAGSLLKAVGLPELITFSTDEYESRAVELALEPAKLRALRQRLAENRSRAPLFDTDRFRRHLEAAYDEMWSRHESGQEPSSFSVPVSASDR